MAAYIINTAVTYISNAGVIGGKTIGDISNSIPVLITPAGYAFAIWGPIFILEAVFVVLSTILAFRQPDECGNWFVHLSYVWWALCLLQAAWVLSFLFESIWLSTVLLLAVAGSLALIRMWPLKDLPYSFAFSAIHGSALKKWTVASLAGFSLHFGWVTAASLLNVCICFRYYGSPLAAQLASNASALLLLPAPAMFIGFAYYDPVYPLALGWALLGSTVATGTSKRWADVGVSELIGHLFQGTCAFGASLMALVVVAVVAYTIMKGCSSEGPLQEVTSPMVQVQEWGKGGGGYVEHSDTKEGSEL